MEFYTPGTPGSVKVELTRQEALSVLSDLESVSSPWAATVVFQLKLATYFEGRL
jgi:hypothetical protein